MLNWLRSIDWLAINTSALLLVVLLWMLPSSPQHQQHSQPCTDHKSCENYQGDASIFVRIGTWVSLNHESVEAGSTFAVAAFTLLLFVSTLGLWVQTRNAVRTSVQGLETVERAYLFPYLADAMTMQGSRVSIQPWLQNAGKTPAIVDEFFAGFMAGGELPPEPIYSQALGTRATDMNTIVPSLVNTDVGTFAPTATPHPRFFYGCAWYRDVFKKPRETRFCIEFFYDPAFPNAIPKYMYVGGEPWNRTT